MNFIVAITLFFSAPQSFAQDSEDVVLDQPEEPISSESPSDQNDYADQTDESSQSTDGSDLDDSQKPTDFFNSNSSQPEENNFSYEDAPEPDLEAQKLARKKKKMKIRRKLKRKAYRMAKKIRAKEKLKELEEQQADKKSKVKHQVVPMSFNWIRIAQNNLNQTILKTQAGVAGPGQTYLYVSYQFKSAVGDLTPKFDLSGFGAASHIFSPQIYGFGVLGQHVATSAPGSTVYRTGLYYTYGGKFSKNISFLFLPFIMFNDMGNKSGRFHFSYFFNFWNGLFIIDGGAHNTWKDGVSVRTMDLVFGLRLMGRLRAVVGLDHASADTFNKDALFTGLEYRVFY